MSLDSKYRLRDFDWVLLSLALAISVLGLIEIHSATRNTPWQDAYLKQILWVAVGLGLFWICSRIDYHTLLDQTPVFYALSILGLLGVLLFGHAMGGAKRWIPLPGGFSLQVSEFVKVVVVLLVARSLSQLGERRVSLLNLAKIGALVGVPVFLVMKQPDLSTAVSYLPILAGGVLAAGLRWKHALALALGAVLILPLAWQQLQPYQKQRLVTFLSPESDPLGAGYQPIQSKIAVGAGGIWGTGFAQGSQTQLRFLPVTHTDFVFSAYAEETGFVGVALALTLYFALLMRIAGNARAAADSAGVYICMGAASLILFQLAVNIGMVIGRMPVTGLPLPLMSYGGSNTLATFALLGLVNNVRLRRFTN